MTTESRWGVAEAKEKFSEMLRRAADAPQRIFSRERLVAVVMGPETLEEFEAWKRRNDRVSLGAAFEELRALCSEEEYLLEIPTRSDRANTLVETIEDGSR